MLRRNALSVVTIALAFACVTAVATDAFARPRGGVGVGRPGVGVGGPGVGVGRPGVGVVGRPVARGVAVGAAAAVGTAAAYGAATTPRCVNQVDAYGHMYRQCY